MRTERERLIQLGLLRPGTPSPDGTTPSRNLAGAPVLPLDDRARRAAAQRLRRGGFDATGDDEEMAALLQSVTRARRRP